MKKIITLVAIATSLLLGTQKSNAQQSVAFNGQPTENYNLMQSVSAHTAISINGIELIITGFSGGPTSKCYQIKAYINGVGIDSVNYFTNALTVATFAAAATEISATETQIIVSFGDSIKVYHYSLATKFVYDTVMYSGSTPGYPSMADIDNDGYVDFACSHIWEDSLSIFWGGTNYAFVQHTKYYLQTSSPGITVPKVIAKNGSVYVSNMTELKKVFINPNRDINAVTSIASAPLYFLDFDVDDGGNITTWSQNANGSANFIRYNANNWIGTYFPATGINIYALRTVDLNCDGVKENVVLTADGHVKVWDFNFQTLLYDYSTSIASSSYPSSLSVGNANSDNAPDIGIALQNYGVWSFTNQSAGCATGVNENPKKNFKVFPNPATDNITIGELGNTVTISDLTGRIIFNGDGGAINISALTPGIYTVTITNAKQEVFTSRFAKK